MLRCAVRALAVILRVSMKQPKKAGSTAQGFTFDMDTYRCWPWLTLHASPFLALGTLALALALAWPWPCPGIASRVKNVVYKCRSRALPSPTRRGGILMSTALVEWALQARDGANASIACNMVPQGLRKPVILLCGIPFREGHITCKQILGQFSSVSKPIWKRILTMSSQS